MLTFIFLLPSGQVNLSLFYHVQSTIFQSLPKFQSHSHIFRYMFNNTLLQLEKNFYSSPITVVENYHKFSGLIKQTKLLS